ncbi:MAG: DUF1015 domain-containing protein [Dehalococcoidia bacterium]|nr:DUF1015 domain-containing protein [Dehalococcoidia bacterium]
MADVRPFRGLRYRTGEPLGAVLAPPYDVIGPAEQEALYAASPHNVIRVELGRTEPNLAGDNRYTRARDFLSAWTKQGVLVRDHEPAFYLVRHAFSLDDNERARWELLAQVRLAEWHEGVVMPHEFTLPEPKVDRLNLLEATRTNTSHIYCLYRDPEGSAANLLERATAAAPAFGEPAWRDASLTVWAVRDPRLTAGLRAFFSGACLYIADGHHRYETALGYRRTHLAETGLDGTGDQGSNFVFMALTSISDPGLVVLPIHRMARGMSAAQLEALRMGLEREWNAETVPVAHAPSEADLHRVEGRLTAGAGQAPRFALFGLTPGSALVVTPKDLDSLRARLPDSSPALRELDLTLLHQVLIHGYLGIGRDAAQVERALSFTHHASEAAESVRVGASQLAILVNPTRVDQLIAVAEIGEKMPQKSTFFYPKLPTGLVMRPLED